MLTDWQNTIEHYLNFISGNVIVQAVIVLVFSWLLAVVVDRLFMAWIRRITATSEVQIDTKYSPLYFSIILLGFALTAMVLILPVKVHDAFVAVIMTLAIFVWARFLLKITRFVLRSLAGNTNRVAVLNSKSLPLFENMAYLFIIAIAIYYILINWDIDMTAWLASAGIVGIAVGFAAKDTLANLFSGVFIMADAPYKIGDFVVLEGGERGEITKIGIRSTRMITRDDIEVTVPNSIMGNTKILNESGGQHEKFRIRVVVSVAYGCDIDEVRDVLMEIGKSNPATCDDPEPRVRFRTFGASGLDFELLCWIEQPILRGRILDALNSTVYKTFMTKGIEIPYAKQDIYIKEMPERFAPKG